MHKSHSDIEQDIIDDVSTASFEPKENSKNIEKHIFIERYIMQLFSVDDTMKT